jgi:hypothetical protein
MATEARPRILTLVDSARTRPAMPAGGATPQDPSSPAIRTEQLTKRYGDTVAPKRRERRGRA